MLGLHAGHPTGTQLKLLFQGELEFLTSQSHSGNHYEVLRIRTNHQDFLEIQMNSQEFVRITAGLRTAS